MWCSSTRRQGVLSGGGAGLARAAAGLGAVGVLGCSTEYDVTVAELGDDSSLTYSVEQRLLSVGMGRGSWENCPTLNASAEINGVRLNTGRQGGWVAPQYCDDGNFLPTSCDTPGYCTGATFTLPEEAVLDLSSLDVRVWDDTGSATFTALGAGGPTGLAAPAWATAGQEVLLTPQPTGVWVDGAGCKATYRGNPPGRTPAISSVLLVGETQAQGEVHSFALPLQDYQGNAVRDSIGTLTLDCGSWPVVIQSCTGVGGCDVAQAVSQRVQPSVTLQVSQDPTPIALQSDVLNWAGCGLLRGGNKIQTAGCSGIASAGVWTMAWSQPGFSGSFGFKVNYESLAVGAAFTAPLTWGNTNPLTVSESCTLTIEQYWLAPAGEVSVVQGVARCSPPLLPFFFDVSEFTFRSYADRQP